MSGIVILGTDTDAGKTTFCLQWLALFADRFAYWKPVETGESDSETIRRLVPTAKVFPPLARFKEPVAPHLAARREGATMPGVEEINAAIPQSELPLICETFGSPFSPLTEEILQIELIRKLCWPTILVSSSKLGAMGRTLQCLKALDTEGISPLFVVLVGPQDLQAEEQIARHGHITVFSIHSPDNAWTAELILATARKQSSTFESMFAHLIPAAKPDAANLIQRDRNAIWHPYTSLGDPDDPLPIFSAEAEFLHLADGRSLIDGISSWWTIQHGHRHPPLMAALRQASHELDHVIFAGATHEPGVKLAELLLQSSPWPDGRVFYSDNGSTAVEVALKMAYQAWCHRGKSQRTLFIGFEHGYHGDTFGAMAVGRDPLFFGRFEPLLFRALRIPVSAERLDETLNEHDGEVAAIIIEPLVQAAGGMRMHSPPELAAIAAVARRHGVFLIADEVMSGGGRTGTLWAHEQAGIAPDLICAGKTLAGGIMPLAATLASPEIVAAFDTADRSRTFFHGHSFTAHPLACAVAAANWQIMQNGEWKVNAKRIESFWRASLPAWIGRPGVKDIRILGTIAAIEFDAADGYLAAIGRTLRTIAIDNGVLLRPLGNVLYALPTLGIQTKSLERILLAMQRCCEWIANNRN